MNFNRRDRIGEPADPPKPALKPAIYEPPGTAAGKPASTSSPDPAALARAGAAGSPPAAATGEALPSRLFVGVHIKLKGVEISDCDSVVIEGNVEATVHSKALEIAQPGTLHGTADIEVAEIHGEFAGDLTVRTRLVVHGTGRVSGTIRYGKLVVAEGGEISGDVRRRDDTEDRVPAAAAGASALATGTALAGPTGTTGGGARATLAPSSERWSN